MITGTGVNTDGNSARGKQQDRRTAGTIKARQRKREVLEMAEELEAFVKSIRVG